MTVNAVINYCFFALALLMAGGIALAILVWQ
jgi:hypothetical protein